MARIKDSWSMEELTDLVDQWDRLLNSNFVRIVVDSLFDDEIIIEDEEERRLKSTNLSNIKITEREK